jgi:hypothetical protein
MLITVAAATVTFIGIVYSLLFLVVQFGSTTFTPRLNLFRGDPVVWRTFAFYTAVVIYSLTASLVIGQDENTSGAVPIVAFVAVLTSIALYRRLTTGAFNSIQLASALAQVARRGREVIDGLYILDASAGDQQDGPGRASTASPAGKPPQEIRWPRASAVLQVIDVPRVLRAAEQANAEVDFKLGSGELVAEGAIVAVATGQTDRELEHVVLNALTAGEERTYEQDPLFAIRVLADIALRALSPAVNDPTTAVQALDAMDGLLRALATRELNVGRIADRDGILRITLVLPTWEDYRYWQLTDLQHLRATRRDTDRRSHRRAHLTQPRTTRGYGSAEREGSNPRRLRDRLCLLRAESADARARWPRFFGLVVLRRRDDGYGDERDPSASKEDRYSVREPPDTARALADRPTTPDEAAGRRGSYGFSRVHRADTTTNARMAPGSPGPSGRPGCRGSGGAVPRRL